MAIRKPESDCMMTAVMLALDKPRLSDSLWVLRAAQMESGLTFSGNPDQEAENLTKLFQAAGETATVIPLTVRSLRDMTVLQRGDQLFVGLPGKVTGKPHIMYVGEVGNDNMLSRELVGQQLPENIASGFTFHLIGLAFSEAGLQTFIRRR